VDRDAAASANSISFVRSNSKFVRRRPPEPWLAPSHVFDGGRPITVHRSAVLTRLAKLSHHERLARNSCRSRDCFVVPSMASTATHARSKSHGLPNVHAGKSAARRRGVSNVGGLPLRRRASRKHSRFRHQRFQKQGRIHQTNALIFQNAHRADQRVRIFCAAEKTTAWPVSNPRMERKFIVLHLTAITACVTLPDASSRSLCSIPEAHPMEPFRGTLSSGALLLQRDHAISMPGSGTSRRERKSALPAIRPIPLRWFLRWP